MQIEQSELLQQLQGQWTLDNDTQNIEIKGNELIVHASSKPVKTSFELIRNVQLGNWQIKVTTPVSWLRTFVVQISETTFTLYDFNLKVNMAMGARSKLLNPTRVFKYTRMEAAN